MSNGIQEFFEAVQRGDSANVQRSLDGDPALAHARWDRATALHFAALENYEAIASMLLDAGADANALDDEFGMTPLGWANERGHGTLVKFLAAYTRLDARRAAAAGLIEHVR